MTIAQLVTLIALAAPVQTPAPEDPAPRPKADRLLALDTEDAASFAIYRDADRKEKLELRREPIYRWTNPTRVGGQVGDVFVWTYRGRPEAVGSIFSHPHEDGRSRVICHELHSLSTAVLVVDRPGPNQWKPEAPGVELKPIPDAPEPAATAPLRLAQLRALAREFSGRSLSDRKEAWELRLLPRPLYRYEGTDPDVHRRRGLRPRLHGGDRPGDPSPPGGPQACRGPGLGLRRGAVLGHEPMAQAQGCGGLEFHPRRPEHLLPRRQAPVSGSTRTG